MVPLLEAQICDVWGVPLAGGTIYHTSDGGGLEVIDPLNDSRTARLTVPIDDRCARPSIARPLDRLLSVTYGTHLLFKGPILQVSSDFGAGTVTISAHDPTIKLKHHYHDYGDLAVDGGYTVDGNGLRILVESSLLTSDEDPMGDRPPNGILWGYNNTTPWPDSKRKVAAGTNVWESLLNMQQVMGGPDFRFRPVDEQPPGVYPATLAIHSYGFMVELDTNDKLGDDKSGEVIYEYGLGADNAETIVHEPDGDVVRNRFTYVYPGGKRSRSDDRVGTARNNASINDYGLMQGYESSGQKGDSQALLQAKARSMVKAYARSPDFFTVVPRIDDGDTVPRYPRDIVCGDSIRARARRGERDFDSVGRIIRIQINSIDQAGNARTTLECVPDLDVLIEDE